MITREHVATQYENIDRTIKAWESAIDPKVRWRGSERKAIAGNLIEAWHALFNEVATLAVEQSAKLPILVIDEFELLLEQWAEGCSLEPENTDPRGPISLWAKWGEIREALSAMPRRKPESIKTLTTEKVSDRQIALIYGWFRGDNEPDIDKVREEKESPGKHYSPVTWTHPDEVKNVAAIERRWQARQSRIDNRNLDAVGAKESPETIEELIRQRVSSKQIAMMKRVSVDEVQATAARLGIPLDGQYVPSVSGHDKMADMRQSDSDRDAELTALMAKDIGLLTDQSANGSNAPSLLERVLESHIAGKSSDEIAAELKTEYRKITAAKVTKMIESATREAAGI